MIDEQLILGAERLRDDLRRLKDELRERYTNPQSQVTSDAVRQTTARLAEIWLVSIATRPELGAVVPSEYLADLNVHFQRLLTYSERASVRSHYDSEINAILLDFTNRFVIPLKQLRNLPILSTAAAAQGPPVSAAPPSVTSGELNLNAFLGHSFAEDDKFVVECVAESLEAVGVSVVTGRKPRADRISEKVKRLIDSQAIFVGLFTCRERIARREAWTTSPWVIDEKAYAVAKGKRLILIKEVGVSSIGGIQGDYEFVEFSRDKLHQLVLDLLSIFELRNSGLRA